jgi:hypothetical protein
MVFFFPKIYIKGIIMKNLGISAFYTCLLFLLLACQPEPTKLDTKNAQSLRASIYEITKDMSEPEKVDFAKDFTLLFQNAAFSSKEGMRSFFDTRLAKIIPTSETDDSVIEGFSRILIDYPSLYTNLDATQLKEKANAVRAQAFEDEYNKTIKKIASIKSETERLKNRIPEITATIEKNKVELLDSKAQRDSILEPITVKRFTPLGNRVKVELELAANNVLDKPVKQYFIALTTKLKDRPNYQASHVAYVTPSHGKSQATSSEVTKITYKPSLFLNQRKQGLGKSEILPSSIDGYEFSVQMSHVTYLDGGVKHWRIIPELETKIAKLPAYIESCERAIEINNKFAEDMSQYAEQLKKLSETPSLDISMKEPKTPRVSC